MTAGRLFLLGWLLLTGGCMDDVSRMKDPITAPHVTQFNGTYTIVAWPESVSIPVGGTASVRWTMSTDAAARAVTATLWASYTSQDNTIAVVDGGGVVTGRAPGTTAVIVAPVILAGQAPLDRVVAVSDTVLITVLPPGTP